jgi:hypothetical protein
MATDGVWTVSVHAGREQQTPAKAKLVVVLCGEKGEASPKPLLQPQRVDHVYEPGAVATFEVYLVTFIAF